MDIKQMPAHEANYTPVPTPPGRDVSLIVVHVMDGTLKGTDAWFGLPVSKVSAHYGVGAGGQVHQYVGENDIAWHAGDWDVNKVSIGIEHEGYQRAGQPDWVPTALQLEASVQLAVAICRRWGIVPSEDTIIPHSRVNPTHGRCPGGGFPLDLYIREIASRLEVDASHVPVRLFDPVHNVQVGEGTLIRDTDKVYVKSLDVPGLARVIGDGHATDP